MFTGVSPLSAEPSSIPTAASATAFYERLENGLKGVRRYRCLDQMFENVHGIPLEASRSESDRSSVKLNTTAVSAKPNSRSKKRCT